MPILSAITGARAFGFTASADEAELEGAYELISTSEPLTASNVATVSFSSISSTYDSLELRIVARGANTTSGNILLRYNGDTGSNYRYSHFRSVNNNVPEAMSFTSPIANQEIAVSSMPTSGATASTAQSIIVRIPNYKNTARQKTMDAFSTFISSSTSGSICFTHGLWQNTDAITQVDVSLTTTYFGTGTRISLYGYKGV